MTTIIGWSSRALITAATTAITIAALALAMFVGIAPAWAHVQVNAEHAVRGAETILTFEVPNESDHGAKTTKLAVTLPNVEEASTEEMPGWTAALDRDTAAGVVKSVTWTATPPEPGIAPDQFALFRISVKLPDSATASFPATQTYSDGQVVNWDQPTPAGGAEPEHPAPVLTLTTGPGEQQPAAQPAPKAAPDDTARWLAGVGVVIGVIGVLLAVLGMRRRS
jgi:uncharacterized protein YcnI